MLGDACSMTCDTDNAFNNVVQYLFVLCYGVLSTYIQALVFIRPLEFIVSEKVLLFFFYKLYI